MAKHLKYKNYKTIVRFSKTDQVYYGKIEAIKDLVLFEATSLNKIENCFQKAVDDYLDTINNTK